MPKGIYLHKSGMKRTAETKRKMSLAALGKKKNYTIWNKGLKGWNSGEKNPNWKGGKARHSEGYVLILQKKHPFSNHQGYIPQHRLVMEKHIGRYLYKGEMVHHINGNKKDNRIENLELTTQSKHLKNHYKDRIINNKGQFV